MLVLVLGDLDTREKRPRAKGTLAEQGLDAFPYVGVMTIERFSMYRPVAIEHFSICG